MANALYADEPSARLAAATRVSPRHLKAMAKLAVDWPADSPGSLNAWLLLVTTKPPTWRDPYVEWRDMPPALGSPHEGFFYPDPLGFWAEVRHWSTIVVGEQMTEALSVTTVLHGAHHLAWALELMRPRVILFLDESAADASHIAVPRNPHHIRDPFRAGQIYEGWWGESEDGAIVGKSPQHPAAHKLYTRTEMDAFLSSPGRTARS